jgi:hypothetical protein
VSAQRTLRQRRTFGWMHMFLRLLSPSARIWLLRPTSGSRYACSTRSSASTCAQGGSREG